MSQVKIIWVQDEYDGPMNGIVEYNNEKLWFSRVNNPAIISSTEIPVPYISNETDDCQLELERTYVLSRLNNNDMIAITNNHIAHCEKMGAPINHGDPIKIKRKVQSNKISNEAIQSMVPEGKSDVELQVESRALVVIKQYDHSIVPGSISGEYVTTIKESEISNYNVPRTFIVEDQ